MDYRSKLCCRRPEKRIPSMLLNHLGFFVPTRHAPARLAMTGDRYRRCAMQDAKLDNAGDALNIPLVEV